MLTQHLPEGTEESHKKKLSDKMASQWPKILASDSQIWNRDANHLAETVKSMKSTE